MLKIIRLLFFCLILDAYYDNILADPWEPDKSWFTSDVPKSTNASSQVQTILSDDSFFNRPREYAKIIHFIRQIKSMVKNNQIETAKRREDEAQNSVKKLAVAIPSASKQKETDDVTTKVNHKNLNDHHRHVLKKVKKLLTDMKNKHIMEEESDHSNEDLLSNKDETRHWVEKDKIGQPWTTLADKDKNAKRKKLISILSKSPKKKVETPSAAEDDLNEDKEKIEKEVLNNEQPSQREGKITNLSGLISKLRKIAEIGASKNKTPVFPTDEGGQNREKPRDLLKDQAAWIGLAAGGCLAFFAFALCFFVAVLIKTFRRKRDGDQKPLDLNFNCPPESYKKHQHPAFTHMHDPKTGRRYIVLMDDSTNYSITSSDSSSEEEIYNASRHSPVASKPVLDCSHRSSINRTSTPIKSPLRLTRSAPGSPSVRRNLSKSWSSPPVSPLACVTPVFASPIKLPG